MENLLKKLEAAKFNNESLKNQLREIIKAKPDYEKKKAGKLMSQIVYAMANIFKEDTKTVVEIFKEAPEKEKATTPTVRFKERSLVTQKTKKELRVGGKQCEDCEDEEEEQPEVAAKLSAAETEEDVFNFFFEVAKTEKATISTMREFCKAEGIKISNNAGEKSLSSKILEHLQKAKA